MNLYRLRLIFLGLLFVIGTTYIYFKKSQDGESKKLLHPHSNQEPENGKSGSTPASNEGPAELAAAINSESAHGESKSNPATQKNLDNRGEQNSQNSLIYSYKYKSEMQSYIHLAKKVILTDEEKNTRLNLVSNSEILESLPKILLNENSPQDLEVKEFKNKGLNLLYEALSTENKEIAISALKEIILDQQIENPNMNPQARQELAELKGEVLYELSARNSDSAEWINQKISGPATTQIWKNVLNIQKNNLAESNRELRK